MELTTLTFNLTNTAIRRETLHGRNYIVAPMAMLTEGVHNGSGGPLLYREAECRKAIPAWNMKPIVVYHPQINGQGVSACDPGILESQQVGMVLNTCWKGKLRAEAWIEESRAAAVDNRVIEALEENRTMEVSTGLFTENVKTPGQWNGVAYDAVATNHQPDHLALLPDQIGACSIADGAGLLQLNEAAEARGVDVTRLLAREMDHIRRMVGNAMSHTDTNEALRKALRDRFLSGKKDKFVWVVDVYEDRVIYEIDEDDTPVLFSLGYTSSDAGVVLDGGEPTKVVRVTEYRTPEGKFVGNNQKEKDMDKTEIVNEFISNADTGWDETDREGLMKLDEAILNKMKSFKKKSKKEEEEMDEDGKKIDNASAPAPVAVLTAEQYIDNAPAELRDVLRNSLATHNTQKQEVIAKIVANVNNKFTAEFLGTKDLEELLGMAALAGPVANQQQPPVPMFFGAATPQGTPVQNMTEGPLTLPIMSFDGE